MSSRSALRISRTLFALVAVFSTGSLGCWEQWSVDWFPQMKRQLAVQAYEPVFHEGQLQSFAPPDGTVPIDGGEAPVSNLIDEASDHLLNPHPMSLASVENGRALYQTFCVPCHGPGGLGNGLVSMTGPLMGPFVGVLPIAGPASVAQIRSDGHVYTTIRYGRRRMPSYGRIPPENRWDLVNYIRFLNGQRGIEP